VVKQYDIGDVFCTVYNTSSLLGPATLTGTSQTFLAASLTLQNFPIPAHRISRVSQIICPQIRVPSNPLVPFTRRSLVANEHTCLSTTVTTPNSLDPSQKYQHLPESSPDSGQAPSTPQLTRLLVFFHPQFPIYMRLGDLYAVSEAATISSIGPFHDRQR
jgi:hypothetical protein